MTLTPSDIIHKKKTMRPIRSRSGSEIVSIVGEGTPRDSALPMARCFGDTKRPTSSRWCAGQCRRTGDQQGVAGQFMIRWYNEPQSVKQDQHDRSFHSVNIKYFLV